MADGLDLTIQVSHCSPGKSKWNKIEHGRGSYLSLKWHGQPLGRHGVIVDGITATTIHEGLTVRAEIDPALDETGMQGTVAEFIPIRSVRDDFHGEWNQSISLTRYRFMELVLVVQEVCAGRYGTGRVRN